MTKITWKEYEDLIDEIATGIPSSAQGYSAIVGLARGGLVAAVMLAHKLEIDRVYSWGMRSYSGQDQTEIRVYQPLSEDTLAELRASEKFLIVDDVVDNQKTLKFAMTQLEDEGITKDRYHIATTVAKGEIPDWLDFYGAAYSIEDWIVFPFEE